MLKYFPFLVVLFISVSVFGQLPPGANLSTINIGALSDEQFMSFVNRAQLSGLSEEELEAKAKAQGLTDAQVSEIRSRLSKVQSTAKAGTANYESRKAVSATTPIAKPKEGLPVFGEDFFSNSNLTFEPNLKIATPVIMYSV
jgi:hypothetical protein